MKFDSLNAIKKIAKEITKSIDLKETSEAIINEMANSVGASGGALFLIDEQKKEVKAYKLINTMLGKYAEKLIKKDVQTLSTPYKNPLNKVGESVKKREIFIGDKLSEFICPAVPTRVANLIQKVGRLNQIMVFPATIHDKVVGCILLAFQKKINLGEEKMLIIEIFADQAAIAINNALKYEELQKKHADLKKRFALERETTSLLSHELKTPIAISHNNSQLLRRFIENNAHHLNISELEQLTQIQQEMMMGLNRMNYVCNSIFHFREVENQVSSHLQKLDLERTLEPLIRNFKLKAKNKKLKFSYKFINRSKQERYGAGVQFEQIVSNLIDNAIKYTEKGSVELKIIQNTKSLKAIVIDTGISIPKKERELIFESFKRSKGATQFAEGLGLGLYIIKKILEQLSGKISVTDNPMTRGTKFTVSIPIFPI